MSWPTEAELAEAVEAGCDLRAYCNARNESTHNEAMEFYRAGGSLASYTFWRWSGCTHIDLMESLR